MLILDLGYTTLLSCFLAGKIWPLLVSHDGCVWSHHNGTSRFVAGELFVKGRFLFVSRLSLDYVCLRYGRDEFVDGSLCSIQILAEFLEFKVKVMILDVKLLCFA